MKQHEQVIEAIKQNGGYATLGYLNHTVDVSNWKTKTPFASIRRIVQDGRYFFKIRPGLWALKDMQREVLNLLKLESVKDLESNDFNHTYYQGLLLEIGNLNQLSTYIPQQDKNKIFLSRKLSDVSTLGEIYGFSFDNIVQRAKTIDVIWFNNRRLPAAFFEVEHSTDFQNSLAKFVDLQDFYSRFYIVSSEKRKKEYAHKLDFNAFRDIKDRVKFINYEEVSLWHTKIFEYDMANKYKL